MRVTFYRTSVLFLCLSSLSLQTGCDVANSGNDVTGQNQRTVLVANGGNFGDQNGTISSYDPETEEVQHSPSLNGFLQGLVYDGVRLYALVNTFSIGRVSIVDPETMRAIGQMESLPAPRAMVIVGDTAYVTNLVFGSNGVVVPVSVSSNEAGDPIMVGEIPEGIAEIGGRIYVANNGNLGSGRTLSIFDVGEKGVRTIEVPCDGPRDLFVKSPVELIILCTGKTVYNDDFSQILSKTNGSVIFLATDSEIVTNRIDLDTQLGATNGTVAGHYASATEELYATAGDVNTIYRINARTHALEHMYVLEPENGLIGLSGIAYDATHERLYVGRFPRSSAGAFPDFTSSGSVVILNRDGTELSSFIVGPAPSQILLLETEVN